MCRSTWRRFGIRYPFSIASALVFILLRTSSAAAQQSIDTNVLQMPQVRNHAASAPVNVVVPQADPPNLIRIPVTVVDDGGRCVPALTARDFSLSVDGDESPIAWFRPNRATAAALGVLVDISQAMEFRSFSGRILSGIPQIRSAIKTVVDKLDTHDDVFLATFARRFHLLFDYTTDHHDIEERLPMLRVADELDDFDGSGIYESMIKAITVLAHAPKTCDRRALLLFTNAYYDSSNHGAEDVIAKAQFADVTIYTIVLPAFVRQPDPWSIRNGLGRIAAETGGRTFFADNHDGLVSATDSIASELDSQYVLGFPVSPWGPNAVPIELMLPYHPRLHLRAPHVARFRREDLFRQPATPPAQILPE